MPPSAWPVLLTSNGGGGTGGLTSTRMPKRSLTVPPLPSSAVTFTDTTPASAAAGVPEKVRVEPVKLSQPGSALSSNCAAV